MIVTGAGENGIGVIRSIKPLDREERRSLLVPLIVSDSGTPPCSATVTFTVHVSDINDNPLASATKNIQVNLLQVSISFNY